MAEASRPVRATRQRAAISARLARIEDFVSAQELHRLLTDEGVSIGLATVYRTLQSQEEAGELDAVRGPDGEMRYRQCGDTGHHHHLVCRYCGRAEELDAAAVEAWAHQIAAEYGFTDVEHTVELFGTCRECSARTGS